MRLFDQLWAKIQRDVWIRCRRACSHREDAEDLMQDVWLRAERGFHSFRGVQETETLFPRFRAWVMVIVNRLAIDYWRKKKHKQDHERPLGDPERGGGDQSHFSAPPSSEAEPQATFEDAYAEVTRVSDKRIASLLSEAMQQGFLNAKERAVLLVKFIDPDSTWNEIADKLKRLLQMDLTPAHCTVIHFRALPSLRVFFFLCRPDLLGGPLMIREAFEKAKQSSKTPLTEIERSVFQQLIVDRNPRYRRSGWQKALENACSKVINSLDISLVL